MTRGRKKNSFNAVKFKKVQSVLRASEDGVWIQRLLKKVGVYPSQLYRYLNFLEKSEKITREPVEVPFAGASPQRVVLVQWIS